MYKKILVALDNSDADKSLLPHVTALAKQFQSQLLLVHVADGWVARNFNRLKLAESEEMKVDRAYLESTAVKFREQGLTVSTLMPLGDPPTELLHAAEKEKCDLIAMTAHGHRLLGDLFFGSTIHEVRHRSRIPMFLVRGGTEPPAA
jgi:nucleotide-binding universal stress UspA family protein